MDKCHITDEKGDHIQDPADAEDAVFENYVVHLSIRAVCSLNVMAESDEEAIKQAKKEWLRSDIEYEYTYIGVEWWVMK